MFGYFLHCQQFFLFRLLLWLNLSKNRTLTFMNEDRAMRFISANGVICYYQFLHASWISVLYYCSSNPCVKEFLISKMLYYLDSGFPTTSTKASLIVATNSFPFNSFLLFSPNAALYQARGCKCHTILALSTFRISIIGRCEGIAPCVVSWFEPIRILL